MRDVAGVSGAVCVADPEGRRRSFSGAWLTLTLLGLGLAYVGYWPTLRSVTPRLAVDAAFFRAILPPKSAAFMDSASPIWVVEVGSLYYRVDVESPNPWGGKWNFNDSSGLRCAQESLNGTEDSGAWGIGSDDGWRARDIPVRVELATSLLIAPIAFGQELLIVVGGLACAVLLATRPPRGRMGEVAATLAGVLLVVGPVTPLVEFVRVRPWLTAEALSAWRVHGTVTVGTIVVLCAVRLHFQAGRSWAARKLGSSACQQPT